VDALATLNRGDYYMSILIDRAIGRQLTPCGSSARCEGGNEMDLRTYFQLFWVPAIASAVLMALLWAQDERSGRAPLFLSAGFSWRSPRNILGQQPVCGWPASHCRPPSLSSCC